MASLSQNSIVLGVDSGYRRVIKRRRRDWYERITNKTEPFSQITN